MLENGKITPWQLFCMMAAFLLGSPGIQSINVAGRDTWISAILGIFPGIALVLVMLRLAKEFPDKTLIEYLQINFGKILGRFFGLFYIFYFFILTALVLRTYGELFAGVIMLKTPMYFFHIVLALTVGFVVYHKLEVMGRLSEIFLPGLVLVSISTSILISISISPKSENLLPVLERGLLNVIKGTVPIASSPFLELILFTMIFPYVNNLAKSRIFSITPVILIGMLNVGFLIQGIMIFGEYMATLNFPRYAAIRLIYVGQFIERIEVILLLGWLSLAIIKMGVCLYAFILGLAQLFGLKENKHLVLPSLSILAVTSGILFGNVFEMLDFLGNINPIWSLPFQVILPIIMVFIVIIRGWKSNRKRLARVGK